MNRFGEFLPLDDDLLPNLRDRVHQALTRLHEHYGRGRLLAINNSRCTIAYLLDGVGVRHRNFRVDGTIVHLGRHSVTFDELG